MERTKKSRKRIEDIPAEIEILRGAKSIIEKLREQPPMEFKKSGIKLYKIQMVKKNIVLQLLLKKLFLR